MCNEWQEFEVTLKKMMEGNMTLVDALGGYQLVSLLPSFGIREVIE